MKIFARILGGLLLVCLAVLLVLWWVGRGSLGSRDAGAPTGVERPGPVVAREATSVRTAADELGVARPKQVLFGDLHVHTTLSTDAFLLSLPAAVGEGAHPPADACDFARYCSALDFWSINDHAEALTRSAWDETVEAIRQCNAVAGDPSAPDTVAFLGWEWTQVGTTPDDHYGHKNVVLLETGEGRVPDRAVAATGRARQALQRLPGRVALGFFALASGEERMHDFARYVEDRRGLETCPDDAPAHEQDCQLTASRPDQLFAMLDAWGFPALVIPHGTTWGFYTPPGSEWRKQLSGAMHDPERQRLFEIYSGHGTSEVHRDWRAVTFDDDGRPACPSPRPDYLPTCWRAGEIVRERCLAAGDEAPLCEERARAARENAAAAFVAAHLTVPGEEPAEWLDAGQCRDCLEPAFNYRPGGSAQYVLALGGFEGDARPRHFRMGFMSSSDNHFARPGTGYKEVHRRGFTESSTGDRQDRDPGPLRRLIQPPPEEPVAESRPFDPATTELAAFQLVETERQSSFFTTGGLVGVHSEGRDRRAIWDALERREVFGTSGPRMLLWFDLLNAPGSRGASLPMGSEVQLDEDPIFQVRAVGSFEQKPGCPDWARDALGAERLAHVCKEECHHPSDQRRPVTRIEVVRIRPQVDPGEPIAGLIDDPWRSYECEPDPAGCVATFTDPEWRASGRGAVYYARAYEPPRPSVNGANLGCTYDESGRCVEVDPCRDPASDCLAPVTPRAWSSPIWVDPEGGELSAARATPGG